MAKAVPGATLPVLRFSGGHTALGRTMGAYRRRQIVSAVEIAHEVLTSEGTDDATLRAQIEPYLEFAERHTPGALRELEGLALGADVPFDTLFRLNCFESRPPGSAFLWSRPDRPAPDAVASLDPDIADTGVPRSLEEGAASETDAAPGGCTSIASRSNQGVVVGHTEDSSPENLDGIYLLDATVLSEGSKVANRFSALNYAMSLAGCAAAVNGHGLMIMIDALPDPDRRHGVPRSCVSRVLLDQPSIDEAIDLLHQMPRGGGWNYFMVQGHRIVNVETTATTVIVNDATLGGVYAHSNHYLTPEIAERAGHPRPNSIARLGRAQELVRQAMHVQDMISTLSDRSGFPDSICRERTIAAWVADTGARTVKVCWGEPEDATWTTFSY